MIRSNLLIALVLTVGCRAIPQEKSSDTAGHNLEDSARTDTADDTGAETGTVDSDTAQEIDTASEDTAAEDAWLRLTVIPTGNTYAVPGWNRGIVVMAESNVDAVITQIPFTHWLTDNADTDWNSCPNLGVPEKFHLFTVDGVDEDGTDNVNAVPATWDFRNYLRDDCDTTSATGIFGVAIATGINIEVTAGVPRIFNIQFDSTGASIDEEDEMWVQVDYNAAFLWEVDGETYDGNDALGLPAMGERLPFDRPH